MYERKNYLKKKMKIFEKVIKEWYNKSNKKMVETISWTTPWIKIEVDMWKIIWQSNKKDTQFLRIIVDYNGNVISSYPIDKFSF